MRLEVVIIIITEWIALVFWAIHFNKYIQLKDKLFTAYLLLIAVTETLNVLLSKTPFQPINLFLTQIIIPLEFLFLYYYLLWKPLVKYKLLVLFFWITYLFFYFFEKIYVFATTPIFDSLSYGIGCLLLTISIVIATVHFLKQKEVVTFTKSSFFWIMLGTTIFYLGSFPYYNFITFLNQHTQYYTLAYALYYIAQSFCVVMYLLFAYAAKWTIK